MMWHILLEVCPLGPYSKYQGYHLIGIHIHLIVNIISYATLYQYEYIRQLFFKIRLMVIGSCYMYFEVSHILD